MRSFFPEFHSLTLGHILYTNNYADDDNNNNNNTGEGSRNPHLSEITGILLNKQTH